MVSPFSLMFLFEHLLVQVLIPRLCSKSTGFNLLNNMPGLFDPDSLNYQFAPGLGYQARIRDAGGSVVVKDLTSATTAINTIVYQGEGNPGPYDDKDHLEKDHYAIFEDLQNLDSYQWDTYDTIEEPKTEKYLLLDIRIYEVRVRRWFSPFLLECILLNLFNSRLVVRFPELLMRLIASSS
jgi:Ferritin-like